VPVSAFVNNVSKLANSANSDEGQQDEEEEKIEDEEEEEKNLRVLLDTMLLAQKLMKKNRNKNR
jgi:hypothetical protein